MGLKAGIPGQFSRASKSTSISTQVVGKVMGTLNYSDCSYVNYKSALLIGSLEYPTETA